MQEETMPLRQGISYGHLCNQGKQSRRTNFDPPVQMGRPFFRAQEARVLKAYPERSDGKDQSGQRACDSHIKKSTAVLGRGLELNKGAESSETKRHRDEI